jgi:hypothetical protein
MAQQNAIINGSLTFTGTSAGSVVIQAQSLGSNLTLNLPNTLPVQNQLLSVASVAGNLVTLSWASPSSQGSGGGSGTVTSVALTAPAIFSVAGSPVTTSGTLALTLATQSANTVWAGPATGAAAAPTFRALVAADIPALPYLSNTTVLAGSIGPVTHQWVNTYNASTGAFTTSQPQFSDIAGSLSLSVLSSGGASTGQVLTYNGTAWAPAAGGGGAVSSVFGRTGAVVATSGDYTVDQVTGAAPLASPTFTGTINGGAANFAQLQASGLNSTGTGFEILDSSTTGLSIVEEGTGGISVQASTGGFSINTTSGVYAFDVEGNGMSLATGNGTITISNTGAIGLSPFTGQGVTISGSLTTPDGVTYATTAPTTGQVLTATSATAAHWATPASGPTLYDSQGDAAAAGDNHIASGTATLSAGTATVSLTGASAFANYYVVQLTYGSAPGGTPPAVLYPTAQTGSGFTINSTDATDSTSVINWTAIGTGHHSAPAS